ncbi:MAG: threonine aldolase family protein [Actinobacteria bacterium]|nr:threonine aldolase family protein [Actinomycetota bacterium]
MPRVDLRSDTLTRPTPGMRQAMVEAEVGDDVYGEDPTVLALEQRVADLLGHQAGLFTPTGTMAGQLAVRHHVAPGQELIADEMSHVLRAEMGAAAALSGITSRSWPAPHGLLDPQRPLDLMAPAAGPYLVSTACVVLENTHNFGGGTVQPLAAMQELASACQERGVAVHLDGARLWNAHVATGVPLADYGACADTVSVCLSKGLGAPMGSVLLGSADTVAQARVWRKRLGGGMRQVGLVAAAGAYALEHHLQRLAQDHERAARVARAVHEVGPEVVDPDRVRTNILVLDVGAAGWSAADFVVQAGAQDVRGFATDARHVRYVWHLDVGDAETDHAASVLTGLVGRGRR